MLRDIFARTEMRWGKSKRLRSAGRRHSARTRGMGGDQLLPHPANALMSLAVRLPVVNSAASRILQSWSGKA